MPKKGRRQIQSAEIGKKRWSIENDSQVDSSDDDVNMDSNENGVAGDGKNINWINEDILSHIGDLFQLCKNQCNFRMLNTLLYITLRHFNITWAGIDSFMSAIGGMWCKTAHKWAEIFLTDDFEMFMKDERGGKKGDSFFDIYPELEIAAKLFVAEACSRKSADFKALDLANYIDSQYYEITNTIKSNNELIRSERMCRLDMRRWGCRFESNSQRPYFQGHDRVDVLAYRKEFLSYFLSRKNNYYLVNIGDQPTWSILTQQPRILICKFRHQIHRNFA
jgi:hypothetical protein